MAQGWRLQSVVVGPIAFGSVAGQHILVGADGGAEPLTLWLGSNREWGGDQGPSKGRPLITLKTSHSVPTFKDSSSSQKHLAEDQSFTMWTSGGHVSKP